MMMMMKVSDLLNLTLDLTRLLAMLQSPHLGIELFLFFPHVERLFTQFLGDWHEMNLHHVGRGIDDDRLCASCTDSKIRLWVLAIISEKMLQERSTIFVTYSTGWVSTPESRNFSLVIWQNICQLFQLLVLSLIFYYDYY